MLFEFYNDPQRPGGCPEVAVIMTTNIAKDQDTWNPHVRTKEAMEAVKARFKDPDNLLDL
jgi:type I restriction enzyme R subunit